MVKKVITAYSNLAASAKASIWFLICGFMQQGISIITTPIFTRLLTTEQYGEYSVFFSWNTIFSIFFTLNLSTGVLTQGLVKYSEQKEKFASAVVGLMTTVWGIFFALFLAFNHIWIKITGINYLQMLLMFLLIWSTCVFGIWSTCEKVQNKYAVLVIITFLVSILNPLLGVILVLTSENKTTARIGAIVIVQIVFYFPLFINILKKGRVFFSSFIWKYAAVFNVQLIPHFLAQTVLSVADRIMIERMISPQEAGIYSLGYSIASIMMVFHLALMSTISPWIYSKIKNSEINEIKKIGYTSLILIAIVNLLIIIIAPEAIRIFAPEEYYSALWVIPPVAMGNFFIYCYDLYAKFAFYHDRTISIMISSVIAAFANVVLNYIFINRYGFFAAGYTTLICYIMYSVAHYILMRYVCKKYHNDIRPYDYRIIVSISILFILAGFIFMLTYLNNMVRWGLLGMVSVAIIVMRKKIWNYIISLSKTREEIKMQ